MNRRIEVAILSGLLLSVLPLISQAQLRFGILADPQLTWFTSDTRKFEPNGPVAGFNIGFTAENFFAERYAISTGLSINNLGGNIKFKETGYELKTRDSTYAIAKDAIVKFKGQYLSVPLGLKLKTNEIGYTTFYANLGLMGHIRLKGLAWEKWNKVEREAATQMLNLFFATYHFGAGLEYSLGGPSSLQLGLVYSTGFTGAIEFGYGKISYGSLSLRLGVVF